MSFKALFGVTLLLFALYFWFGSPEDAEWPRVLGRGFTKFWHWISDPHVRIYTIILCLVAAVTSFMTIKKY